MVNKRRYNDKYFFIYTTEEGGNFLGWRIGNNLKDAKRKLSIIKKNKMLMDFFGNKIPIHSIRLLKIINNCILL